MTDPIDKAIAWRWLKLRLLDALAAAEAAPLDVERLAEALNRLGEQGRRRPVPERAVLIAREYAALHPDTETAGEAG